MRDSSRMVLDMDKERISMKMDQNIMENVSMIIMKEKESGVMLKDTCMKETFSIIILKDMEPSITPMVISIKGSGRMASKKGMGY